MSFLPAKKKKKKGCFKNTLISGAGGCLDLLAQDLLIEVILGTRVDLDVESLRTAVLLAFVIAYLLPTLKCLPTVIACVLTVPLTTVGRPSGTQVM